MKRLTRSGVGIPWLVRMAARRPSGVARRGTRRTAPKRSRVQMAKVEKTLRRGAAASGYMTDVWMLSRVAEVTERLTGVAYHPGHV